MNGTLELWLELCFLSSEIMVVVVLLVFLCSVAVGSLQLPVTWVAGISFQKRGLLGKCH